MKNNKKSAIVNLFTPFPRVFSYFSGQKIRGREKMEIVKPKLPKDGEGSKIFLLMSLVIFLFSVSITIHTFFVYREKMQRLHQLVERTDQMQKDSLLIQTLGEEEKKNNLLSLAVDYGYAHTDDLVVYIKYPPVVHQSDLSFKEVVAFSWKYVVFLVFCVFLFFQRKNFVSFYFKYGKMFAFQFLSMFNKFSRIFSKIPPSEKPKSSAKKSGLGNKVKIISDYIGQVGKKGGQSWWHALFPQKKQEYPHSRHYLSYSSLHRRKMR